MIDEQKKELIKKLQALAERGVGGEKEGARKKLEQLMQKYNIEEADLSEDKVEDYDFKYHNEYEVQLLRQLFYKIVPDYRKHAYIYTRGKGSRSTAGISCTKAQALQIQIEYEFYCDLWKDEVDFFFRSFVQKHRIFGTPSQKDEDNNKISNDEYMRMVRMMGAMQDKSILPMIEKK